MGGVSFISSMILTCTKWLTLPISIGAFMGIITASLPTLRPLFHDIKNAVMGGFSRPRLKSQPYYHSRSRQEDSHALFQSAQEDVAIQDDHYNGKRGDFPILQEPASLHLNYITRTLEFDVSSEQRVNIPSRAIPFAGWGAV